MMRAEVAGIFFVATALTEMPATGVGRGGGTVLGGVCATAHSGGRNKAATRIAIRIVKPPTFGTGRTVTI
jgi:hypothetical protein